MSASITNQATIDVRICGETHTVRSNLVKVRIRQDVSVCLQAKKIVCNTCLRSGQFKFAIFDKNKHEIAQAKNEKNGDVLFSALTFDRPGVYTYTMREVNKPCRDWILDHRCYTVIVTIFECQKGKLIATVSYPEGLPIFVNRYCPCNEECIPGSGERMYLPRSGTLKCSGDGRKDF